MSFTEFTHFVSLWYDIAKVCPSRLYATASFQNSESPKKRRRDSYSLFSSRSSLCSFAWSAEYSIGLLEERERKRGKVAGQKGQGQREGKRERRNETGRNEIHMFFVKQLSIGVFSVGQRLHYKNASFL